MACIPRLSRQRLVGKNRVMQQEQIDWYRDVLHSNLEKMQTDIQNCITCRLNNESRFQQVTSYMSKERLDAQWLPWLVETLKQEMSLKFGDKYIPPADHVSWYSFSWVTTGEPGSQTARLYITCEPRNDQPVILPRPFEIDIVEPRGRAPGQSPAERLKPIDTFPGSVSDYGDLPGSGMGPDTSDTVSKGDSIDCTPPATISTIDFASFINGGVAAQNTPENSR